MPTDAGEAFVKVLPDTTGFSAALSGGIQTSGVTSAAKKIGQAFGVALGARTAVQFLKSSFDAFAESEKVTADLNAAIGRTPELLGETTVAFQNQATALQNLTGYQDEEILKADTVLTRFKLTGDQIRETIPLVLDYARATGTDVAGSAEALGKALLGNTRALKTLGIDGFVATGDRAVDLANLLDQLNQKVGGTAETFGDTLAGKIEIAKAKFDDFKEKIGEFESGVLLGLTGDLDGAGQAFGGVTQNMVLGIPVAEDFAHVFGLDASAVGDLTAAQSAARTEMQHTVGGLDAVQTAAEQAAFAADGMAQAQRDLNTALREGWTLANEAAGGLVGLAAADADATEKRRELAAAQNKVNTLVANGKKGTKEYAQAVRDRNAAELDSIQSQQNLEGQAQSLYTQFRKGNVTLAEADRRLRAQAQSAGLSAGQTNALVDRVNALYKADSKLPKDVVQNYLANGLAGNLADLALYNQYLSNLNGKQVYITVHTNYIETGARPHGGVQ